MVELLSNLIAIYQKPELDFSKNRADHTSRSIEGQEKDVTTARLARMNMILHAFPTAKILSGNTVAAPKF